MRAKGGTQITVNAQADAGDAVPRDDANALAAIFRTALPQVYGFILLRVAGNTAVAEDLTSETFLAFAIQWPRDHYRVSDPTAWLIGIARNKVLMYYRAEAARAVLRSEWTLTAEQIPDFSNEFDQIADRDELFQLLSVLPVQYQAVLLLRYLDGYAVRDIAAMIGKSEHATESMLSRARTAMRNAIRESEESPTWQMNSR